MFLKKNLYLFAPVLLLSNVLTQGMDVTVSNYLDGSRSVNIRLKEYNAFVDALKHEKYEFKQVISLKDKWDKLSLNTLVEEAAYSSDTRYLKKLMEDEVYAQYIKVHGLKIFEKYVDNDLVQNIKLVLAAGADVNTVVHDSNKTLLWYAVMETSSCYKFRNFENHECDKIIELLIKRGADVTIAANKQHPTLLRYIEHEINSDLWQVSAENREKLITLLKKVKELLINAPQIHADYLKKNLKKEAATLNQERLANFKSDASLKIKNTNFNIHAPILAARCNALSKF